MAGISSTGVGSGLDVESIVSQLMAAEAKAPTLRLNRREARLQAELSAVGSIKGALSDFQSSLSNLTDAASFSKRKASSSDTDLFTVSANSSASPGTYGVEVQKLAQAHKIASGAFADSTSAVGTGTLRFQFGTFDAGTFSTNADKASGTVTIDASNNSLEGIRDAVNEGDFGVRASIINDGTGDRLVFASEESGAANSLRVTASGDGDGSDTDNAGLSLLSYDPTAVVGSGKNLTETVAAQDALATIDGIDITSSTNTLSSAIEGVSIDLKSANVGTTETLTVALDKGSVSTAVDSFVKGFNSLIGTFNSLTNYNAETEQAGILIGDSGVRGIENQLRNIIGDAVPGLDGSLRSLADLGISTQRDGTLSLDQSKLQDALDNNFDDVSRLFAAVGQSSDSLVAYSDASDATQAGTYAVDITQLATQGLYTGGAITNTVIDGTNNTFSLKINGIQSGTITLAQADYTGIEDQLAAELQSKINGDDTLSDADLSVTVAYDSANSRFTVTSDRYGSDSTVEITSANAALGLSAGTGVAGVDVEGSIGGASATGLGQTLTGTGAARGLQIDVSGGATGSRGSIVFSRGVADRLDGLVAQYLESDSFLDSRTSSIERQLDTIDDQREQLKRRLDRVEQRYRDQFTQLDVLMAQMQTTSEFLTNQLSALPGASKSK